VRAVCPGALATIVGHQPHQEDPHGRLPGHRKTGDLGQSPPVPGTQTHRPQNPRGRVVPADQPVGLLRRTDPAPDPTRDLPAGPAGRNRPHRAQDAPVEEFTAAINGEDLTTIGTAFEPAAHPAPRPVWDWAAANERKKAAITGLAPLTELLDDIDARIDQLAARANRLEDQ